VIAVTYTQEFVKGLSSLPKTERSSWPSLGLVAQDASLIDNLRLVAGKDHTLTIPPQSPEMVVEIKAIGQHSIELEGTFGIIELDLEGEIKVNVVSARFQKIRVRQEWKGSLQIDGKLIWNEVVEIMED
jgi:hypothetical protein